MCGRFTLAATDPSQLRARWPVGERLELRRRYNVAPGDEVLAVVQRPRAAVVTDDILHLDAVLPRHEGHPKCRRGRPP